MILTSRAKMPVPRYLPAGDAAGEDEGDWMLISSTSKIKAELGGIVGLGEFTP